ncbi:acyl-CoA synthetase [Oceanobacillus sp. CF4.6]|uniref:acyl-CoA synthetase n=1 Tax=Oceanobacillus sp. CF4.6 TaxID=3373080 RepID=UPI003EE55795
MTTTYQELVDNFSWDKVLDSYDWNPREKFNPAHESCDKWAKDPNRVAIYWEDEVGNKETWTFAKLKEKSDRMANWLRSSGVEEGDRVAGLLGKDMELIITVLATWKVGALYVPLFTAFGPRALEHRLLDSGVKMLVTNKEQSQKVNVDKTPVELIIIEESFNGKNFWEYLGTFSKEHKTAEKKLDKPFAIQYTSGSTGLPKGAVWSPKIFINLYPYQKYAIGIEEGDLLLGGADLGWSFGLVNCTFAPLMYGTSIVLYKGKFEVEKYYQLMQDYQVTNFAFAPTAYRAMMAKGPELVKKYNFSVKKFSSAGEPLNAEVVRFFQQNFGRAIYDHYGATEMGMPVNNYNVTDMEVKPGSMGFPLPGNEIALLDSEGEPVEQGEIGEIAFDRLSFPYFFLGYWKDPEKTESKMVGRWLLSGDLASVDKDGYYWFEGRSDDIISSAGYRIGPFEVESSLIEHEAVQEVAAVGKPDEAKGEIVKAYVVLKEEYKNLASEEMAKELSLFVKERLSKHQYPREIEFLDELPKTQSGKIQRFILRNQMQEQK